MVKAAVLVLFLSFLVALSEGGSIVDQYDFAYEPELPPIFGLDFLGWGFDATYRDPFFALKPQMFKFSYNVRNRKYRYPIDIETYSVPDQVFVRTVAKTNTYAYDFFSTTEERQLLDLRLNIKVATTNIQGQLDFSLEMGKDSTKNSSTTVNLVETSLYQLYLGERIFLEEFKEAMEELSTTYRLEPLAYKLFLARFGTHFVDSIVLGGSVWQRTVVNWETEQERLIINAALQGKFESSTGKSKESANSTANADSGGGNNSTSGGGGGGLMIEGSLNVTYSEIEDRLERSTTSSSEIYGGDPQFTDFVLTAGDPKTTKELFDSWKATLVTNPIGVRYRLVEIWQLFDDPQQKAEVCTAVATALGFLPDEDPSYCEGAGVVRAGTIRGGLEA